MHWLEARKAFKAPFITLNLSYNGHGLCLDGNNECCWHRFRNLGQYDQWGGIKLIELFLILSNDNVAKEFHPNRCLKCKLERLLS